jgi:hypothetical protein
LSLCVTQVCANHPLCCILTWDASCVTAVKNECGYSCQGC